MASERPQDVLGALIRQQREKALLSMREFAESVGISNPYLSQIERGLRAPSDAVLDAIARRLNLTIEDLYARAGFVDPPIMLEGAVASDLPSAIDRASELTAAQRRAMSEIYRGFVDANLVRRAQNRGQDTE